MPDRSLPTYTVPETLPTDPVLADLVPEFLAQWVNDLTVTWQDLRQQGDLDGFRRFGHTIKGSFLQFGFKELSAVGKEIMHDADDQDWDTAQDRIHGILAVLVELQKRIDDGNITIQ